MNRDRLIKLILGLLIFFALVSFSVGKLIYGGVALIIAAAVHLNMGGGSYNERNLYEKSIPNSKSLSLEDLYGILKDIDTPLGRCWIGNHASKGRAIIFGPNPFRSLITATIRESEVHIVSGNDVDNISAPENEQWRFDQLLDTKNLGVTPKRYSIFAAEELMTAVTLDDLAKVVSDAEQGTITESAVIPRYTLYHYNSSDNLVRDAEDNLYAKTSAVYDPLSIIIYDMDGNEAAKVTGNMKKKREGFRLEVSGEEYGTIYWNGSSKSDEFILDGEDGEFRMTSFRAVRRANIGSNYVIRLNGERKAVVGCSHRIDFPESGLTENDIICSFDDEYLLWYIALQEFMTTNNRFVK